MTISNEAIRIGNWLISQDTQGNLVFNNGSKSISFTPAGKITGHLGEFIEEKAEIRIQNIHRGHGYLNLTSHGDNDHPINFTGWAFWMSSPDDDSKLIIEKWPS